MTNHHVIESKLVEMKNEIAIYHGNESKILRIKLDEQERIIICFKEILNVDITLVEIIPKDNIDDSYFLIPKTNYFFLNTNGQKIQVVQYPLGRNLSYSDGCIKGIYCEHVFYFYHNASTQSGSSGSPIVFNGEDKVFAIHKGTNRNKTYNVGIFIGGIIEIMKVYKKNGKYKEYYNNGNLKYDGNFKDDEYNDENGQYIFENGDTYIGQFKNGKKHGKGLLLNKNYEIIKDCEYENDIDIIKKENSNNNMPIENINHIGPIYEDDKEENNENNGNGNNLVDMNNIIRKGIDLLHPLGNILCISCTKCGHKTGAHVKIESGMYQCKECPNDSNICKVLLK